MTTTPPLQAARAAMQRLSVQEQALLLIELAQQIAAAALPAPTTASAEDIAPRSGFAQLRAVAADIHAAYPHAGVGAQLDADRRDRDAAMRGEAHDVHA